MTRPGEPQADGPGASRPNSREGAAVRAATYALARPARLDLDSFARAARLHPDLVRRLVTLGLLEVTRDARGQLWFDRAQLAALARIQRLHAGLSINYAALGIVVDLLDRIAELEAALRHTTRHSGGRSWTRTA